MLNVCDKETFIKRAEVLEEVICYGAGQEMKNFIFLFEDTIVLDKCSCIVDQDENKQGLLITVGEKKIPVVSLEKAKKNHKAHCAIIITCAKFVEIINCFETDSILHYIDYYSLQYFKRFEKEKAALSKKLPQNIRLDKQLVIPKVIHYFWVGGKSIPEKHKRWMESWHRFCPDYEIKEWNEYNYDISKNKYMKQAYEKGMWGFVPDYARLDIVYQYGGIYLDTDVELLSNIDDFLYQKAFACFESETKVNFGMGFGAIKGLKIIKDLRDDYENHLFIKENGELNLTASPVIQTEFLQKKGLKENGEYQIVGDLTIYPEKVMGGKSLETRRIRTASYTRAIHHFEGSWLPETMKMEIRRLEDGMSFIERKQNED